MNNILYNFIGSFKSAAHTRTNSMIAPYNKQVKKLCLILEDLGFIYGFTILNKRKLKVYLKYYGNKSVVRSLNVVSKPSSRVYFKKKNIKGLNVSNYIKQNSFLIISTSKMNKYITDVECLILQSGGEPVCVVA